MPLTHPLFGPLFLAGLAAAGVWDVRHRRVPNALNFGLAALGLAYQAALHGLEGVAYGALGWIVMLFCMFVPFLLGLYRGGDAKLVMAVGAWLGPRAGLSALVYGAVAGGLVAAVVAARHRETLSLPPAERPDEAHAPMALGFGAGAALAVLFPLDGVVAP